VVICVAWSQAGLIGRDPDAMSARALGLGAFWAALTVLARAAFSAIDMRSSWRRTATVGLFALPVVVTVTGLAIGRAETTVIGICLLAALVCAALLPSASQLTQQQLLALTLTVGAGIIAIYPVAIALARPSLNGLRSSGATLPVIFGVTGVVAVAAFLICGDLIASRRTYPDQSGLLGATQSRARAATHGATAADQPLLVRPLPPLSTRPCTAIHVPRQKTAGREDEDQPRAQSERSRP